MIHLLNLQQMQMSLTYYWDINLPQFGPWQYRNKTQKVIFLLTVSLWKSCPFYTSFILHSTVLPLFCYCYSNYVCPLFLIFKPKFRTSWNSGLKVRKTILVYLSPQHVARRVLITKVVFHILILVWYCLLGLQFCME